MAKAKVKKTKHIFLFLRIAVVTALIIWAVFRIGQEQRWAGFVQYLRRMNLLLFVGILGVFIVAHIIVGLRWWLLLRAQSIFIGFWVAVRLYFLGWFYNNFMPSSLGGDLIRAGYVTRHTEKRFEAALSVFVDRVIGLFSTLTIAVFFSLLFLRGQVDTIMSRYQRGFLRTFAEYRSIFLGVIAVIVVVFCGFLVHRRSRALLKKAWSFVCLHTIKMTAKLKNAAIIYCRNPLTILAVFGLTVFVQIMVITSFWVLGVNMGIPASIKYYYVFFTLTWVFGAIPISIGGAGVVEGSLVIMFTQFAGIEESAALAIALSQRAVWMLTSLPGAVIHLLGAHLPRDSERDKVHLGNP
ncbi:hypothetical protein ES703_69485 [subsurface metagenome]